MPGDDPRAMGCVQSQEPTPASHISDSPQVLAMTYLAAPEGARIVARAYTAGEAVPTDSKLVHLVRHGQASHNGTHRTVRANAHAHPTDAHQLPPSSRGSATAGRRTARSL